MISQPAVWFPTIRTGTGTDIFTERLVSDLKEQGLRAEITWLPLHAEYAPWSTKRPQPPSWANICHINTWLHSSLVPKNLPIIATIHHSIHDPALLQYKGWLRANYHRHWIAKNERRIIHQAREVTAVSDFVASMAKQTLCDVPMNVIYNGVDTKLFHPPTDRKTRNPFRLLYIGSWISRKGVDVLTPIMKQLGNEFELYYTGPRLPPIDEKIQPKNMHNIGRLNGEIAITKSMHNADAFIFPSRSEGFGLVAAEAMACGLPVIATRGSSIPEIINDGENGILCAQDNIQEFAAAARKLAHNSEFYSQISIAARQRIESHFTSYQMVSSYIKVYKKILNII
ncbi:glycosyltransferase family 4 protein [Comamonas sp.]|uniref:glycosyltransferase family 4 protein n=1 Tax=Comamonas sp. TaxID=34028 RepID=UPI0028981368|nr:glycosyltransferase family 4 protein [Comamonas sp.]